MVAAQLDVVGSRSPPEGLEPGQRRHGGNGGGGEKLTSIHVSLLWDRSWVNRLRSTPGSGDRALRQRTDRVCVETRSSARPRMRTVSQTIQLEVVGVPCSETEIEDGCQRGKGRSYLKR